MGQLPSAKDTIVSDTTTSATYEDIDGLTVQLTVDDQSDILLMASVQATGSTTALAGYRLVFDGTNYLEQERTVGSEPGNIAFFDRVINKTAGTYTFKLQHKVDSGTLTTENAIIVAVSLHSGSGAVPNNSVYVATDTVGNAWEDIPGLTADVTLSKTSHIAAFMCWHGSFSAANRDASCLINIDGTDGPINSRNFDPSGNVGQVSHIDRTTAQKTAGTYTVKGRWKGAGGATLTGNDFELFIIAGEANSGAEDIDIQHIRVASDTTTATALEDIDGSTVTAASAETAHILGVLSLRSDVSIANMSAYTTVSINAVDYDVMERGHVSAAREGSVGQFARTDSTLSAGDYTVKGRWYTDSTNTLTGDGIDLVSIVLAATGAGEVSERFGDDSSTVDDDLSYETILHRYGDDASIMQDNLQYITFLHRLLSETQNVQDEPRYETFLHRYVDDSTTVEDNIFREVVIIINRLLSDSTTVDDALQYIAFLHRYGDDTVNAVDTLRYITFLHRLLSDGSTVQDDARYLTSLHRLLSDSTTVQDDIFAALLELFEALLSETITVSDDPLVELILRTIRLDETLSVGEQLQLITFLHRYLSDAQNISDDVRAFIIVLAGGVLVILERPFS